LFYEYDEFIRVHPWFKYFLPFTSQPRLTFQVGSNEFIRVHPCASVVQAFLALHTPPEVLT